MASIFLIGGSLAIDEVISMYKRMNFGPGIDRVPSEGRGTTFLRPPALGNPRSLAGARRPGITSYRATAKTSRDRETALF